MLSPYSVTRSQLVVGQTSKSWRISLVFIGKFSDGSVKVWDFGKSLVTKDLLPGSLIHGKTKKGYPLITQEFLNEDESPLYKQDWSGKRDFI